MLESLIKKEISKNGPIPFSDFMEMALYNQLFGYYSKTGRIGKSGDFYTSVSVDSLFGELLGKQIRQMIPLVGEGFTIVEMGAADGSLAKDILGYLGRFPEGKKIKYLIIERFTESLKAQKETLKDFSNVEWRHGIRELPMFTGCFISNELIDSFPVHRVVVNNGLKEIFVDSSRDGFRELLVPASKDVEKYFADLGITLEEGQKAEVNLAAISWIKHIGSMLKKGFVITIDYGYPAKELYSTRRRNGTFLCYKSHATKEDPYSEIGLRDMTSHVDFTTLAQAGKSVGLKVAGFTHQAHFLIGLGAVERLSEINDAKRTLRFKRLITPEDMGGTFKVLVQHKGISNPVLDGLSLKSRLDLGLS